MLRLTGSGKRWRGGRHTPAWLCQAVPSREGIFEVSVLLFKADDRFGEVLMFVVADTPLSGYAGLSPLERGIARVLL